MLVLFLNNRSFAQLAHPVISSVSAGSYIRFYESDRQKYGFDSPNVSEWTEEYDSWKEAPVENYRVPFKSVAAGQADEVAFELLYPLGVFPDSLKFMTSFGLRLNWYRAAAGFRLNLVPHEEMYTVTAFAGSRAIGLLQVRVYPVKNFRVVLVPLVKEHISADSVQRSLNAVYKQALLRFTVVKMNPFYHRDIDTAELMENPSMDFERYTEQMQHIRNLWMEAHPDIPKDRLIVFITPGFTDEHIRGFMVRGKAIGFIVPQKEPAFSRVLARNLARGIGGLTDSWRDDGPDEYSTNNLMDRTPGTALRKSQWELLQMALPSFSVYDNYENVRTNNGMIAYYFWSRNADGTIAIRDNNLLKSIKRPFKKNYYSYHLNVTNFLFRRLFSIGSYRISTLHILIFTAVAGLSFYGRKKIRHFYRRHFPSSRVLRFTGFLIHASLSFAVLAGMFGLLDTSYGFFEVRNGEVAAYHDLSLSQAIDVTGLNENQKHPTERHPASQVFFRTGKNWSLHRVKQVLHFTVKESPAGIYSNLEYSHSNDSLVVPSRHFWAKVRSHYFVVHVFNDRGKQVRERVFNHFGSEITDALHLEDPVRRILVFVNGYRPTSLGATFEDKFRDIRNRGLEFPDSRNIVYDFDRFDYWNPWNQVDEKFRKRINPGNVYYADGHFGVRTSNYRSLLNFSTVSAIYPKRCQDLHHHVCYTNPSIKPTLLAGEKITTIDLLKARSNKKGFNERRKNGRIAGRNILQMLNDIPNRSENDTLYIVAHSMGYAYALGIVDELRGHIHFGAFYIIAPENASAGKISTKEWKEVWQYGSKMSLHRYDPPCLQDGVAPQFAVAGLPERSRIYFPVSLASKRGFFDTHFIGYYDWMFDIPRNNPGYIVQR